MTEEPISDGELKQALNSYLEEKGPHCPICGGDIGSTTSELYDRECHQCKTKYNLRRVDEDTDSDRRFVPEIAMRTTPVKRMKRKLWQKANREAALETFREDDE